MVRRLAIVVLLIAGVTLIVVAGAHNLRHRQVEMQKAQQGDVSVDACEFVVDVCGSER